MSTHQTITAPPQETTMSPHTWQLLEQRAATPRQASRATTSRDLAPGAGTGVTPASPSMTVITAGVADTAAGALEEAFDAAELHVLTTLTPFVLLAAGQELRVTPSPASDELSLVLLAELRREMRAELQRVGR